MRRAAVVAFGALAAAIAFACSSFSATSDVTDGGPDATSGDGAGATDANASDAPDGAADGGDAGSPGCAIRGPFDGGFCDDFDEPGGADEYWIPQTLGAGAEMIVADADAPSPPAYLSASTPAHGNVPTGPTWGRAIQGDVTHASCTMKLRIEPTDDGALTILYVDAMDDGSGNRFSSELTVETSALVVITYELADGGGVTGSTVDGPAALPTEGTWHDVTFTAGAGEAFTVQIDNGAIALTGAMVPTLPATVHIVGIRLGAFSTAAGDGGVVDFDDVSCDLQ